MKRSGAGGGFTGVGHPFVTGTLGLTRTARYICFDRFLEAPTSLGFRKALTKTVAVSRGSGEAGLPASGGGASERFGAWINHARPAPENAGGASHDNSEY